MKDMFLKKSDIYYQKWATVAQRFQLVMTKLGACDEIRWNDGNLQNFRSWTFQYSGNTEPVPVYRSRSKYIASKIRKEE